MRFVVDEWAYVRTCMPALFGHQVDAWHGLSKHVPQIGIAPAAGKLNTETMFSGSSVCAGSALTSRSLRVSAPEYPFFILIPGPLF